MRKVLTAIIMIAVTVAVSIAVSITVVSWMNSSAEVEEKTNDFGGTVMLTEELRIRNLNFVNGVLKISVSNTGKTDVSINSVSVNGFPVSNNQTLIESGENVTIEVPLEFENGKTYLVSLISTKGNIFTYTGTA